MPLEPRRLQSARIRTISTVLMVLVGLFWVVWLANLLRWYVPFVFQGGMQNHPWVEPGVIVSTGQYTAYGIVWGLVVAASCVAFWLALRLLRDLRAGAYFSIEACEKVQRFGLSLVAVMAADTILGMAISPILTWGNAPDGPVGRRSFEYFFDSGDITIALCGLGFYGLGWVFQIGFEIERENREFV